MALKPITHEDLKYRLNKLKCCFANKASDIVDKQRFGKVCADEMCNLKLLGAYIEMIECYAPLPCDCSDEWVADGSLYFDHTTAYTTGQVVKFFPRISPNPGEYLYIRWQGSSPSDPAQNCFDVATGHWSPCFAGLQGNVPGAWSICGHVKVAWEAAGYIEWNSNIIYNMGDIVKFMGGGPGANQSGRGRYYISTTNPNPAGPGFNESGHWVELTCYNEPA
tara:strand:- start:54467 stop:55129 length:663 start_codon:yes stop_codon:yes gene_type:complete